MCGLRRTVVEVIANTKEGTSTTRTTTMMLAWLRREPFSSREQTHNEQGARKQWKRFVARLGRTWLFDSTAHLP